MAPEGAFLQSNPHPRAYGNFARFLGHYVRERGGTSLEPTLSPEQLGSTYDNTVHYQSFFFPPTGVLRHKNVVLAIGAGERANPQGPPAHFNDGDDSNNNHYYVVKDSNPLELGTADPHGIDDALAESNLDDLEDGTVLSCPQMQATREGYFITARDAEKFVVVITSDNPQAAQHRHEPVNSVAPALRTFGISETTDSGTVDRMSSTLSTRTQTSRESTD